MLEKIVRDHKSFLSLRLDVHHSTSMSCLVEMGEPLTEKKSGAIEDLSMDLANNSDI